MARSSPSSRLLLLAASLWLAGCGSLSNWSSSPSVSAGNARRERSPSALSRSNEVVIFALGLMETGYRFGGKNPEAGLDCSGMVSYVFDRATNLRLSGSAADIARKGKPVDKNSLLPGDLVFFNTANRPYSHVGIYIGDGRFIHAPSSKGSVRTESLNQGWFASRFEEARSYLD